MSPLDLILRRNLSSAISNQLHSTDYIQGTKMFVHGNHSDTGSSTTPESSHVDDGMIKDLFPMGRPGQQGPPGQHGPSIQPVFPGTIPGQDIQHNPKLPPEFPAASNTGSDGTMNSMMMTSTVTYVIVAAVTILIVVALVAFILMKRRRNAVPMKLLMPVNDDKKLECRDAIVTYKTEEECMGLDPHFEICSDGLGKANPSFILPPNLEEVVVDGTVLAGGVIPITALGGLYKHPNSDIYVSVPEQLHGQDVNQICVVTGPARNPPDTVAQDNVLSDMITLLPHHASLSSHVLVRFPIRMHRVDDVTKIQLLYSDTDPGDEPHWVNLQQRKTSSKHRDDVCWFVSDGYCYLYARHFCHVFLAQHCQLVEQPALFLQASAHGEYLEKDRKLVVRVGFHCSKCNPGLLDNKQNWGCLLGNGFKCIYGKEGGVMVNLQVDARWIAGASNIKEVDADDLMNLCNLNDIYPPLTFTFRVNKKSPAICVDEDSLEFKVMMSQGTRKNFIMEGDEDIYKLVKRSSSSSSVRLERSSGPEENTDSSLEPIEHGDSVTGDDNDSTFIDENANVQSHENSNRRSYEQEQNDENANRETGPTEDVYWRRTNGLKTKKEPCENDSTVTSVQVDPDIAEQVKSELPDHKQLVPYQRKDSCAFNECVSKEQLKLCSLLEPNPKKEKSTLIMKEICETPTPIDIKNFSGHMILQMWNMKVKVNQKTWGKLYQILSGLKMEKVAQQLKVTVDKDRLMSALDDLKVHLQMEPLLSRLAALGVVTSRDLDEMRSRSSVGGGEWLEYLVYHVLNEQPVNKLYEFYRVVERLGEQNKVLVKSLQLCPSGQLIM